jgi:hypothetical protein
MQPESIKIAEQVVSSNVNGKTTSQEPDKLKTSKVYPSKAFKIGEALLSEKQTLQPKAKKIAIALLAGVFLLSAGSAAAYYFMPINELEIEPKEMTLVAGEDIGNYRIIVKPSFVKQDNLVWDLDTENSSYAAIRKGWSIQPLKPGSRTITVSTKDGRLSASCKIIVIKPTITWKGGTYSGEMKDGIPHGEGEWSNTKGETYTGRWVNGKYSGQGSWTHPSGEKYDGYWKDGVFHGLGTWYGPNGEKYVGQFKNGLWHGRGEYTDKTGKIEKWIWDSGKKIDNYIAAIDAEVVRLRFFESGYYEVSLEERIYSNRFAGYQTLYIIWELELHFPSNNANRYFSLTHVLSRVNGGEIFRETIKHEAPANWDGGYWPHGYGSTLRGAAFSTGKYRVEILEKGRVVASGTFEIY